MAKTPAQRQRAHRRRVRLGLVLVKCEINEVDLVRALIDARLLDFETALDTEAVAVATERALGRWMRK
jgi:hypothetical protein